MSNEQRATGEVGHRRDGWMNYCQECGGAYFVRAVDLGQAKMRRFVSAESDARHECGARAVSNEQRATGDDGYTFAAVLGGRA